jgi:hypothetical protein
MPNNFEQDIQSTRTAFTAHSLPPGFVITPQPDGSVAVDRRAMARWEFPGRGRSQMHSANASPAPTFPASTPDNVVDPLPPEQQQVLATLSATFQDLAATQQFQLAVIKPLMATAPDTFKERMAALRKATIDSVNAAVNKAYDELKNAGLQTSASQPLCLQAAQLVGQLAQGFVDTVGSSLDAVDHAGSLVIGGLSEGASEVEKAFSTAGDAVQQAAETVLDGLESVFSGW